MAATLRPLLVVTLVSALFAPVAWTAEAPVGPPAVLDLNAQVRHPERSDLPPDRKAVKGFEHAKHAETYLKGKQAFSKFPYEDAFTCAACHHTATRPEEVQSCLSCKTVDQMFASVKGAGKFKNLFHETCRACHTAMAKVSEPTGPTRCNGCHGR